MTTTNPITILTFVAYIAGTFVLAGLSHRLLSKKSFMGEYFLGSRSLGSWTLAFTFAATSASGGSFTGYPSLIYTHGWILAFWIASYMIMPLCTMGVMGKRLNQVARKTGAITIPDVVRDRYEWTLLGLISTSTIIFFTVCNLVAQFKAGAVIIETTFNLNQLNGYLQENFNLSEVGGGRWGFLIGRQNLSYIIGLLIFGFVVIFYTAYGGFRAVVWTDVMQGVVMGIGIIILLPVILSTAGGLTKVNENLRKQKPTLVTAVSGENNDLVFELDKTENGEMPIDGVEYTIPEPPSPKPKVKVVTEKKGDREFKLLRVQMAVNDGDEPITTADEIVDLIKSSSDPEVQKVAKHLIIRNAFDNDGSASWNPTRTESRTKRWVFIRGDEFLFGPGRKSSGLPFHPLGMAISFFFMWAISGMGQPGTMVRLIAFKDSRTLKRAILTVTVFFALIYIPLVFIFVSGRTLLTSYIPADGSTDRAMAIVSTRVVADMGIGYAMLAAIFVAAPFAAVMSTVDSFLLMVSSSCVRDVYQRTINPSVSEKVVKRASYATTTIAGIIVALLATQRIDFLQNIIVFTGGGFASTFLCPVFLGIYWKGMTRYGALAAMVGGFVVVVTLFLPTMLGGGRTDLLGFHPVFWGLFTSFALGIIVSKLTGPAPEHLVDKYFHRSAE